MDKQKMEAFELVASRVIVAMYPTIKYRLLESVLIESTQQYCYVYEVAKLKMTVIISKSSLEVTVHGTD